MLISTEDVLESPFPDALLCLSGGQLNILRNLLQYAHRRANFVTEYEAVSYLTPTTEEWDDIQALVADLEDQAMGDCSELMTTLDDILTALECICPTLAQMRAEGVLQPDSLNTDEITDVFEWSDEIPNPTVESEESAAACAISQCWYQAGFEVITEGVLPASRAAFNVILALVAAKIAAMTGGAALPTALGAVKVAELVEDLIQGGYDASESNLYNWMITNKEEIVCGLYNGTMTGGTASSIWQTVYDETIHPAEGIHTLDKLILWLFMGTVAFVIAYFAYTEDTSWAQSVPIEGYCDNCPLEPIIGNDWWAMPLAPLDNTMTLYKAPDTWTHGTDCWEYPVPAGQRLVGYVFKKTAGSTWPWKRMSNYDAGCTGGCQMTPNTSENWNQDVDSTWFVADEGYIDEANCKAALAPTAVTMTDLGTCLGAVDGRQGLMDNGGYGDTFTIELVALYAIFDGTSPPE